jgi:hypothetical protein
MRRLWPRGFFQAAGENAAANGRARRRAHVKRAFVVNHPSACKMRRPGWITTMPIALLLTRIAWRALSSSAAPLIAHPFTVFAIGAFAALSVSAAADVILPTGIGVLLGLAVLVCVIPAASAGGCRVAMVATHHRALAEVTVGATVS